MRFLPTFLAFLCCQLLFAQTATRPYWQQKVKYQLNANVHPAEHTIDGNVKLEYTNQSPDALSFIWFHIWPNAYANNQTALYKQLKQMKGRSKKLAQNNSFGSINNLDWKVNGASVQTEPHPTYNDVVKIPLPTPLAPGGSVTISTPFQVILPNYFSRSGFYENSLFVAQWYPKPAVYDSKGWHAMPYLDMGEFYSEFGQFDVDITVPSNYVVAASGQLQTADEFEEYKRIGTKNYRNIDSAFAVAEKNPGTDLRFQFESYKPLHNEPTKTLHYFADSVHDFAFFTDPNFIINHDTIMLESGRSIDAFSYYQKDRFSKWINSIDDARTAVHFYSENVGEYPYPSVSLVQGAKNNNSGGMEYPMITLITMQEDAEIDAMDAVFAHEIGHNWFCEVLASNERDHAWMDEGINSFYQMRYEAIKNRSATTFGKIPDQIKSLSAEIFEGLIYQTIDKMEVKTMIDQPSQDFKNDNDYGMLVYIKTAAWMYALEKKLGKESFAKCMKDYYQQWRFRHPYPEDMKAVFEKTSGYDLADFFEQLTQKKQTFE